MATLATRLETLTLRALEQIVGQDCELSAQIAPTRDEKHGDYQCNAALGLARKLGRNPRELAGDLARVMQELDTDLLASAEVAGPGFLNLRLRDQALVGALQDLGQPAPPSGRRVVVDYSSPNIAKQMHVGHLRSSIIGDGICRVLEHLGHEVLRQNHVGDWGTQFGLLCAYLMDRGAEAAEVDLGDLEALYREAQALADQDESFRERSRQRVVALHQGDPETLATWHRIVDTSVDHIHEVYDRLGLLLTREDMRGESFYNPLLAPVVEELQARFPAGSRPMEVVQHEGAVCVFLSDPEGEPRFKNAQGEPQPLLVRKSDGAFLYPTTDLAALRYRVRDLQADWLIYVTDSRQALHFQMFFQAAREAGWVGHRQLEHVTFGTVLGPGGTPLKTRAGGNVKLSDLLDEAVERATRLIQSNEEDPARQRGFSAEEVQEIATAVGIGAVKYADLSQNRSSDYVFSFDRMLAMEGNTAPYLMYAYARIRSIQRRAGELPSEPAVLLGDPHERRLALHLARLGETLDQVVSGWRLNLLCEYLYGLSGLYMKFYENCPVLAAPTPDSRASRLGLCAATAEVLRVGLGLLGLRVVERM